MHIKSNETHYRFSSVLNLVTLTAHSRTQTTLTLMRHETDARTKTGCKRKDKVSSKSTNESCDGSTGCKRKEKVNLKKA
jgi:hypothetical protein